MSIIRSGKTNEGLQTYPIVASKREEVASDKYMTTEATLYRNGRLVVDVYTDNDNFWHALRGHVLVILRDKDGKEIGVTGELSCSFRGSSSGWESSSGTDIFTLQFPEEIAGRVVALDIHQKDGRSPGNHFNKLVNALTHVGAVIAVGVV